MARHRKLSRARARAVVRAGTAGDDIRITVVIPTKNEARNVGWVLERLPASVDEVVIVDGQSTDGTVEVARRVRPDLVLVTEKTPGKGAALRAGFRAARGSFVVMLDADGSMDPGEIDSFVELLESGHDFVKGSRFMTGGGTSDMTALRRLGNWVFVQATNTLFGCSYSDLCYGYIAFRRSRLDDLALTAPGFEIETELVIHAVRGGLQIAECPSYESPRRYGESNLQTFPDGWRVLKTILKERFAALGWSRAGQEPVTRVLSVPADGYGDGSHILGQRLEGINGAPSAQLSSSMSFSSPALTPVVAMSQEALAGETAGSLR